MPTRAGWACLQEHAVFSRGFCFKQLKLDSRDTPASNVVFVRSTTEATLAEEKGRLLEACWPVHRHVIDRLGVRIVVCLGTTAGAWVREASGATSLVDEYKETNRRGWRSQTHRNTAGLQVVTLSHPSRADWTNPASDPSSLVQRALDREGSTTKIAAMKQVVPATVSFVQTELIIPTGISAPAVRAAHMHLLETAANMNLRAELHTSAISAIKLYDQRGRYLFSWIINPHHLLFYVRKPALKLAPHLAQAADERLLGVNINPAGEVTVRIQSSADAEALTRWLFDPSTWTITSPGDAQSDQLGPAISANKLGSSNASTSQKQIR